MKAAFLVAACMSVSTAGFAAPASEFEAGKVSVDMGMSVSSSVKTSSASSSTKVDGENEFQGGVTVGLGNNFALQYKHKKNKAKELVARGENNDGTETDNGQVLLNEINLLYKVNPNLTAFIGNKHVKSETDFRFVFDNPLNGSIDVHNAASKDYFQAGVTAHKQLTDKIKGWATLGLGQNLIDYEIGMAYVINKNLEFNVYYDDTKYKSITNVSGRDYDVSVKGFNAGLTFKF